MTKHVVRVVEEFTHVVVSSGSQGVPGQQGPIGPSGGTALTVTSDVAIGGGRFVVLDENQKAKYASSDTPAHASKVLGLTLGATNPGDPIYVQRSGEIVEPSWNLVLDTPVYLGVNGLLTQAEPANPSVFSLIVGFPVTATKLFLSFREPIFI